MKKRHTIPSVGRDVEQQELSQTSGGCVTWLQFTLEHHCMSLLELNHMHTLVPMPIRVNKYLLIELMKQPLFS